MVAHGAERRGLRHPAVERVERGLGHLGEGCLAALLAALAVVVERREGHRRSLRAGRKRP